MAKFSIIERLIEDDSVEVIFHPVISFRRKKIIGLEAEFVSITKEKSYAEIELTQIAAREKVLLNFERFCRRKAMQKFAKFIMNNEEFGQAILFIEVETSLIEMDVVGSGNIIGLATELGIPPNRIALEISNSESNDIGALALFSKIHREKGFIISLNEVGSGYSNLERLTIVEPDILNLDISNIKLFEKEFYKRGFLRAVAGLAKSLGAITFCRGICEVREALICIDMGADLFVGKFFYDSQRDGPLAMNSLEKRVNELDAEIKTYFECKYNSTSRLLSEVNFIAGRIAQELTISSPDVFVKKIKEFLKFNNSIECIYILDYNGLKITESIFAKGKLSKNRKVIFKPSNIGADHSSKDYYYNVIRSKDGIYISEPYISGASGSLCTTISTTFMDENGKKYILCIDLDRSMSEYDVVCFTKS